MVNKGQMSEPRTMNDALAGKGGEELSELALRTRNDATKRRLYRHDLAPILGKEDPFLVAIRVPTHREQVNALLQAHRYVAQFVESLKTEDARKRFEADADIEADAKAAAIVQVAVRDTDGVHVVWPNVGFVSNYLTTDQIAAILNLVNEARAREPGAMAMMTADMVETVAAAVVAADDPAEAYQALAQMQREALSSVVVVLAAKLAEARAARPVHSVADVASNP